MVTTCVYDNTIYDRLLQVLYNFFDELHDIISSGGGGGVPA
jgi:hypothetical protein